MRWRIEEFVFCDQQQSLTQNGQVQQLEPILVELLAYFCEHPNVIISRNELVESVWLGRTVTDSAVNRAITKLRKHLGDNAKAPKFIATFPKKGYKFIASAHAIEVNTPPTDNHVDQTTAPASVNKEHKKTFALILSSLCLFASLLLVWQVISDKPPALLTQVKPLTRSVGQEWHPRISPDQRFLAYADIVDDKMYLVIKQLSDGQTLEVNPVDDPRAWVGPASWNKAGNKIAYLVATEDYCRYYLQSFENFALGKPTLIHTCPAGSYGKIAFTHTDQLLVYAERPSSDSPYELFSLNLQSGNTRRLNQPELVLGGNLFFDLHPHRNALLISSPDEKMWEGFYKLDLDSNELELLFKLDAYICCGIWSHSGERIVMMGEYPAQTLISYDLKGNDQQVEYTGSQRLYAPERHSNNKDYVFAAGKPNLDIQFFSFDTLQAKSVANSSVDDRLAVTNPDETQLAHIGLTSGSEEIWLVDTNGDNQRQLSQFNDQRHIIDMVWSEDGRQMAVLTLNENHLFDIASQSSRILKIPQSEIRNLSFKGQHSLYYSIKENSQWRVKQYRLDTDKVVNVDTRWQFVRFAKNDDDTVWIEQDGGIYSGENITPASLPLLDSIRSLPGRELKITKSDNHWYWQKWENNQYRLHQWDTATLESEVILSSDSQHFDVTSKRIYYHISKTLNTDIFQTVSQ